MHYRSEEVSVNHTIVKGNAVTFGPAAMYHGLYILNTSGADIEDNIADYFTVIGGAGNLTVIGNTVQNLFVQSDTDAVIRCGSPAMPSEPCCTAHRA